MTPTTEAPAPAAKTSSVALGASVTIRFAGRASATRCPESSMTATGWPESSTTATPRPALPQACPAASSHAGQAMTTASAAVQARLRERRSMSDCDGFFGSELPPLPGEEACAAGREIGRELVVLVENVVGAREQRDTMC